MNTSNFVRLLFLPCLCLVILHSAAGNAAQGTGASTSNQTCRNVTYVAENIYEVYNGRSGQDNNLPNSRLSALEAKMRVLEKKYQELQAATGWDVKQQQKCTVGTVHNITDSKGKYPTDCTVLFKMGYRCTGKYYIRPENYSLPFLVFCEMATDGWTYILRRLDGSVNFYRTWNEYKQGFGSLDGEYWLGNELVYHITSKKSYHLRIDAVRWPNVPFLVDYTSFNLGPEATNYTLHVTGFSGLAADRLSYHNDQKFSTKDSDNDNSPYHCAHKYESAGWFDSCYQSNLFGKYRSNCVSGLCMQWYQAMKEVTLKIRSQ